MFVSIVYQKINRLLVVGLFVQSVKKKINWYDNLPLISFIILNNKCRNCKRVISSRYFIVELITGISFLLIYLNFKNPYTIIFLSILSFNFNNDIFYRFRKFHYPR